MDQFDVVEVLGPVLVAPPATGWIAPGFELTAEEIALAEQLARAIVKTEMAWHSP